MQLSAYRTTDVDAPMEREQGKNENCGSNSGRRASLMMFSVLVFFLGTLPAHGQTANRAMNNLMQQAQAAATPPATPNMDCTIILPHNPLSARGLATPFFLTATDPANGPCDETNPVQAAFVQAGVFDPATGQISIYNPLVINLGTTPAVTPVVPTLPNNAIVALWFGFNGNNLTQQGTGNNPRILQEANCVNGSNNSIFGQFSYCNAPAFFHAANAAIAKGELKVPALGKGSDGQTCQTSRSFSIVDQDQSDNLPVTYLITQNGLLAQNTVANLAALAGATVLGNPSDEGLVDRFVDPALGCKPWKVTNLGDQGQTLPALALNELQARAFQAGPIALVPAGDPMVLVNGNLDLNKTNLYRVGVDQPLANSLANADTTAYCKNLINIQPQRLLLDQTQLQNFASPDAGAANSLFTFLAQRFVASYGLLNCSGLTNIPDPISVTTDGNGVAISATINTATAGGGRSCHVTYSVVNQWLSGDPDAVPPPPGGFQAALTIQNTGTVAFDNWTLQWTFPGQQQVTDLWNGSFTQTGETVTVTNPSWNPSIAPGTSNNTVGFIANFPAGQNPSPTSFSVNGTPCN